MAALRTRTFTTTGAPAAGSGHPARVDRLTETIEARGAAADAPLAPAYPAASSNVAVSRRQQSERTTLPLA